MLRKVLFASVAFVFAGSTAYAAPPATLSPDRLTTSISPRAAAQLQAKVAKNGQGGVFDNFATAYNDGLYWSLAGGTISGANSFVGEQIQQAVPFTPTKGHITTKIIVGASYVSGTNSLTVGLYNDHGGLPGEELASGTADKLPILGVCCKTTVVKISPVKVYGGFQYWIVLTSPDNSWETWDYSTIDQKHKDTIAYNQNNTGWTTYSGNVTFVMQVTR